MMILEPGDVAKLRMDPGQMIVLHEILGDQLPVRVDLEWPATHQLQCLQRIAGVALRQVAEPVAQGAALRIEVDEDEAAPGIDLRRQESEIFLAKPLGLAGEYGTLFVGDIESLEIGSA